MSVQLPYYVTVDRLVNGFKKIRVACGDFGIKNMPLSILEINAPLRKRVRNASQSAESDLPASIARQTDTLAAAEDEPEYEDDVDEEKLPEYIEMVTRAARGARPIAVYYLSPDTGQLSAWVHPKVIKEEVEPLKVLLEKWTRERRDEMEKTFRTDSLGNWSPNGVAGDSVYISLPALKKAETVDKESGLAEDKHANIVRMSANVADCLTKPVFAPLFTSQPILAMEPQVDQLIERQRPYVKQQDRNDKLLEAMYKAVEKAPSPDVADELVRVYRHFYGMDKDPSPKNWGMSIALATAVRAMDRFYGYPNRRFIFLHGRKYASASYKQAHHTEYYTDRDMTDARRYKLRKMAPAELLKIQAAEWAKLDPAYKEFQEWFTALNKLDDVGDSIGIGLDWAREYLRFTPFKANEKDEVVQKARELFLESLKEVEKPKAPVVPMPSSTGNVTRKGPPPPRKASTDITTPVAQKLQQSLTAPAKRAPIALPQKTQTVKPPVKIPTPLYSAAKQSKLEFKSPVVQKHTKKRKHHSEALLYFSGDSDSDSEHVIKLDLTDDIEEIDTYEYGKSAPAAKRRKLVQNSKKVNDGDDDDDDNITGGSYRTLDHKIQETSPKSSTKAAVDDDEWEYSAFEQDAKRENTFGAI